MIQTIFGNILDQTRGIIVHGCNTRAIMGAGIALQIKEKYPQAYKDYYIRCNNEVDKPSLLGKVVTTKINNELYIVNAFTQVNYGRYHFWGDENYDAIRTVFCRVNLLAMETRLPVMFPMIGSGLGGGDWVIIKGIIEDCIFSEIEQKLFVLHDRSQQRPCHNC